jgi:hypothetical protein
MTFRYAPLALLLRLLLLLLSGPVLASETAPRFVMADVARVRAQPHERGAVVGLLRINARVEPREEAPGGKWTKVFVPDSRLEGWVASASLRATELTLEEVRSELAKALKSGDKAGALAWADRLRALSPAEVKDLTLARTAYERFGEKARALTVSEALAGQQPLYFAACVPVGDSREVTVLAEFDSKAGLRPVKEPAALARWIAGAPWFAAREGSREAHRVEGGLFASPRHQGPPSPPPPEEDEGGGLTVLERVVLDTSCGKLANTGPLVTWPFKHLAPVSSSQVPDAGQPGAPDAGEPESPYGLKVSVLRSDALELTLGGVVHRFEFKPIYRSQVGCEETHAVQMTHSVKGEHSSIELILHQIISC